MSSSLSRERASSFAGLQHIDRDNCFVRNGIVNKGKSCYANVVMQMFASLSEWCPAFGQMQKLFEIKKNGNCEQVRGKEDDRLRDGDGGQSAAVSENLSRRNIVPRPPNQFLLQNIENVDTCRQCLQGFFQFIFDLRSPGQDSFFEANPRHDRCEHRSKSSSVMNPISYLRESQSHTISSEPSFSTKPASDKSLNLLKLFVQMINSNCFLAKLKENYSHASAEQFSPRMLIFQFFTVENDVLEWFFKMVDFLYDHCSLSSVPQKPFWDTIDTSFRKIWMNRFPKFCPLVDCLYGLVSSKYRCARCNYIFENGDVFQQLQIYLPKTDRIPPQTNDISFLGNIENALKESFLKSELVENFACRKCSWKNTTWVSKKCVCLPDLLIVHFERPCAFDEHFFPSPDFSFDARFLTNSSPSLSSQINSSKYHYFLIGIVNYQSIKHFPTFGEIHHLPQLSPPTSPLPSPSPSPQHALSTPMGHYFYQFKHKEAKSSSFSPIFQSSFSFLKKRNRKSSTLLFFQKFQFPKNNHSSSLPSSPTRGNRGGYVGAQRGGAEGGEDEEEEEEEQEQEDREEQEEGREDREKEKKTLHDSWFEANDSRITLLKDGPNFSHVSSLIFVRKQSL